MKLKRLILLLIGVFLFSSAVPQASAEQQTVLIYMLACDLETDSGAAARDLLEIMKASADMNGLRIVVYIGGAEKLWFSRLEHGRCYDLAFENGEYTILNDLGPVPSTEQDSLLRFLNDYGTDGADLILWGHGSSESCELGYDDLFDRDTLTIEEIEGALRESGLHFRLIGFDACGMAAEETAQAIAPYADLLAASPDPEPLKGWNYAEILPLLSEKTSNDKLSKALVLERREAENQVLIVIQNK